MGIRRHGCTPTAEGQSSAIEQYYERLLSALHLSSVFSSPQAGFDLLFDPSWSESTPRRKALLVVAHPDDESECAAMLYRLTHEAGWIVDQAVVTDGAAGYQYSAPARSYYRLETDQALQSGLVKLRRQELKRAGEILGISKFYFLNQRDTGPTLDAEEALRSWDTERVRANLTRIFKREQYDVLFLLLPSPDTHGHHQSIAVLALQAMEQLNPNVRPAAIGVQTVPAEKPSAYPFRSLEPFAVTRTLREWPVLTFDRRTPMRCSPTLNYSVVVNWVIAEHKSQGLIQMECTRRIFEAYWLFEAGGQEGINTWNRLIEQLLAGDTNGDEKCASHEDLAVSTASA